MHLITLQQEGYFLKMTYCFDLDETLCYSPLDQPRDYSLAQPYKKAIARVNQLFEEGHSITIFTARGATSGTDWHAVTTRQLEQWGVRHHKLIDKGKPHYDLFVDDRATNALEWRKETGKTSLTVGFVASCFDLLHPGHCLFLKDARRVCDHLVVALQVNPNVDRPEKRIPIQTLKERRIQLESCKYVDEIHEYSTEEDLEKLLSVIRPDIRVLGTDYQGAVATGQQYCDQVYYHSRDHEWSSTELINRVKNS
jgi:glycerol-3-phosphate cytidylyltransferase